MRRRELITLVGGMAAWSLAARAQSQERVRRIAMLIAPGADNADAQAYRAAFLQALQQLGWTDGHNVRIETRWGVDSASAARKQAADLVALAPDVIFVHGTVTMTPLLEMTRTVPIVFVGIIDPVGAGFVDSLGRPGGNATGFTGFEYSLSGKWLELLKQVAPGVNKVMVMVNRGNDANQSALR